MNSQDSHEILVGVDGSPGSRAAIRFAAVEADRRGAGVRLLHVAPSYLPIAALYPMPLPFTPEEFALTGREILAEALAAARHDLPTDRVRGSMVSGDRALSLVQAAEGAELVVLGADRSPRLERVTVGSTVGTVAARASVPVVAVPPGWHASTAASVGPTVTRSEVVVGVTSCDRTPTDLLRGALEAAVERKAALRIVHVWELPTSYAMAVLAHLDQPGWATAVEERIRTDAAALRAEYDEVEVEVEARYGQPAEELVRVSADAELLVIARRAHAFPVGHFGSTGRALLRASHCAVMVLPTAEVTDS